MEIVTIQIEIEEELLARIDQAALEQGMSRNDFICAAIEAALDRYNLEELAAQQTPDSLENE